MSSLSNCEHIFQCSQVRTKTLPVISVNKGCRSHKDLATAAAPDGGPEGIQGGGKTGYWPQITEMQGQGIFSFLIEMQLICIVVLVQDYLVTIHINILYQIIFPQRLLHSIENSPPCSTVGSYQLCIIYIQQCVYQSQTPNLSLLSPLVATSLFPMSISLFLFCK